MSEEYQLYEVFYSRAAQDCFSDAVSRDFGENKMTYTKEGFTDFGSVRPLRCYHGDKSELELMGTTRGPIKKVDP